MFPVPGCDRTCSGSRDIPLELRRFVDAAVESSTPPECYMVEVESIIRRLLKLGTALREELPSLCHTRTFYTHGQRASLFL